MKHEGNKTAAPMLSTARQNALAPNVFKKALMQPSATEPIVENSVRSSSFFSLLSGGPLTMPTKHHHCPCFTHLFCINLTITTFSEKC